jgi:hypothetical protein
VALVLEVHLPRLVLELQDIFLLEVLAAAAKVQRPALVILHIQVILILEAAAVLCLAVLMPRQALEDPVS